jgi:hypothetical protein
MCVCVCVCVCAFEHLCLGRGTIGIEAGTLSHTQTTLTMDPMNVQLCTNTGGMCTLYVVVPC